MGTRALAWAQIRGQRRNWGLVLELETAEGASSQGRDRSVALNLWEPCREPVWSSRLV